MGFSVCGEGGLKYIRVEELRRSVKGRGWLPGTQVICVGCNQVACRMRRLHFSNLYRLQSGHMHDV